MVKGGMPIRVHARGAGGVYIGQRGGGVYVTAEQVAELLAAIGEVTGYYRRVRPVQRYRMA